MNSTQCVLHVNRTRRTHEKWGLSLNRLIRAQIGETVGEDEELDELEVALNLFVSGNNAYATKTHIGLHLRYR